MKKIFIITMILLIAFQTNIGVVAASNSSTDNKTITTQDSKTALYPFSKNGKWGYMDIKGNVIVSPQYDYAESFSDGLGLVGFKGKYGYINGDGEIAIPIKYNFAASFQNGNAVVSLYKDKDDEYTSYWIKPNGKYFLKLSDPSEVYEDLITYEPFCGELARIRMDGDEPSYGYIDKKGSTVIIPDYYEAEPFSEGLALVCKSIESEYEFINEKDEVAIPHTQNFSWNGSFSEGLAPVWVAKGKCGFADKNGKIKIPAIYQQARSFSDGLAAVMQNGKWGFIDKNNKWVIKPQYDNVDDCVNGLIIVRSNPEIPNIGKFLYYIDKNNNIIKPKI